MALDDLDITNLNSAIEELRQVLQQLGPQLATFGKETEEAAGTQRSVNAGQRKLAQSTRPYAEEVTRAQILYKESYRQQTQLVSAMRGMREGIIKDLILNNNRRGVAAAELTLAQAKLKQAQEEYSLKLDTLKEAKRNLAAQKRGTDAYSQAEQAVRELSGEAANFGDSLLNASAELTNAQIGKLSAAITMFTSSIGKTGTFLRGFGDGLRDFERRVGVSGKQLLGMFTGGAAGFNKLMNLTKNKWMEMIGARGQDYFDRAIEARDAFGEEFGGTLSGQAASKLAMQARGLGLTAQELAKARRAFMTQTGNDVKGAVDAQNKFVAEFKKKGLNTKDAMQEIAKNSDIMARNGLRFAQSFARAAADAKKIGVDLKKVDAFGDSIISDYEGFLEKQAELGAMGFGFDSSKLAQVAETGDTGALMNELKSQLAAQGKDLTNLRRSEQLALSNAFGIPMEELMRMSQGIGDEQSSSGERTAKGVERLDKSVLNQTTEISALGMLLEKVAGGIGFVGGLVQGWKALTANAERARLARKIAKETGGELSLIDKVRQSIRDGFTKGSDLIKNAFTSVKNTLMPRTPMGPALPAGFAGKETSAASLKGIRSEIMTAMKGTVGDIKSAIIGVSEQAFKTTKQKFTDAASVVSTKFTDKFGPAIDTVKQRFTVVTDGVSTGFNGIVSKITGTVETAGTGIRSAMSNAGNYIKENITGPASEGLKSVGDDLSSAFQTAKDNLTSVIDGVKEKFGPVFEKIKTGFNNVTGSTRLLFSQAADSIKNRWGPVGDALKQRFTFMADMVKAKFSGVLDGMKGQSGGFFSTLTSKVASIGGGMVGRGAGLLGRAGRGAFGMVSGTVGRLGRFGASLPGMASLGMAGIASGGMEYERSIRSKEEGGLGLSKEEAAGRATVQGGAAAAGAILGGTLLPFLGPIGPMVGGFLGDKIGAAINEKSPQVAKNVGEFFTGAKAGFSTGLTTLKEKFSGMSETFKPLKEAFSSLMGVFTGLFGSTEKVAGGAKGLGEAFSGTLVKALTWMMDNVLPPLVSIFTSLIKVIVPIAKFLLPIVVSVMGLLWDLASGAFKLLAAAIEKVTPFLLKMVNVIGSIITFVVDAMKGAGAMAGKVLEWMGIKLGDDVVSRSGYGERALVTPTGVVALNNNDNVVAYADDMVASEGVRLLSKGALVNRQQSQQQIVVDMSRLEQKLDAMVRAIGGMQVNLDGNKVGRVLVTNAEAGAQLGVMGVQSRTTY